MLTLALAFAADPVSPDLTTTEEHGHTQAACGVPIPGTVDLASFGDAMEPWRARSWCAQIYAGLRSGCEESAAHKADIAGRVRKVDCRYDKAAQNTVAFGLVGDTLTAGINMGTGNLKWDTYAYVKNLPVQVGSARDAVAKDASFEVIDKEIRVTQKYCQTEEPMTVTIDWASFESVVNEQPDYGRAGVANGCSYGMALSSLCADRFVPGDAVRSPADRVKGFRCVRVPGATQARFSHADGIVTVGYDHDTPNMAREASDWLRQAFPR